jgi:hypothetical protein
MIDTKDDLDLPLSIEKYRIPGLFNSGDNSEASNSTNISTNLLEKPLIISSNDT